MQDLQNKVAVITGASSGIGQAIAHRLNKEGAKIVLFGRDKKKLDKTKSSLDHAHVVTGDVTKIADLNTLYKETERTFGKIDVLVASAGVGEARHVSEVDEELFDWIVNTNYKGLYFTVQRSVEHLNKGASVILISSAAGHMAWPTHSVYSSTKAAVSYLARSLSGDLSDRGIRVNAISPGFTDTPMLDKVPPERVEEINQYIPVHRFAAPEEIANAVCFLASPKSSYIVGTDLVIDGGLSSFYLPNN